MILSPVSSFLIYIILSKARRPIVPTKLFLSTDVEKYWKKMRDTDFYFSFVNNRIF